MSIARVLGNRVLLKRCASEEQTEGGIIIPKAHRDKNPECEVIAVGPGYETRKGVLVPVPVKPGDHVLLGPWEGHELIVGGEKHLLVEADAILGVCVDEPVSGAV